MTFGQLELLIRNSSLNYWFLSLYLVKPPPPKVLSSHQEPYEIHWISHCDQLELSMGPCAVRHRTEADQVWVEVTSTNFLFLPLSIVHIV